jgi:transcription initiation factor TFIID subunit 5
VQCVAVSPDGYLMASAADDNTIMLWDLGSGKAIKRLSGHTAVPYSLEFSRDGNVLASGGADGTVRVWKTTVSNEGGHVEAATKASKLHASESNHSNDDSKRCAHLSS